ncbi:MAG: hypothetical protein QXV64_01500 [Candidatus Anstonellaceae archaeon]
MNIKRGFIFSLDAFIASIIIFFTLQYLVFLSYSPYSYFHSFRQAKFLSQDTLNSLSLLDYENKSSNLVAQAIASVYGYGTFPLSIIELSNSLIPPQYSYAYEFYDFEDNQWHVIFNATSLPSRNISFNKVSASSSILAVSYIQPKIVGDSPYCNVECRGFDVATQNYTSFPNCTQVPCDLKRSSTFDPGIVKIGLLRLTVWG